MTSIPIGSIRLIREAYLFAHDHSDDLSTRNGALIISGGSIAVYGTNRFPPGLKCAELLEDRTEKLKYIEHAERNVIYKAAKSGVNTNGAIMYCPWACCGECARAIVMSGIVLVVAHKQALDKTPERWREPNEEGMRILKAGEVEYYLLDAKIGHCNNLFNGEVWLP
jgi:dCMP deaminase